MAVDALEGEVFEILGRLFILKAPERYCMEI